MSSFSNPQCIHDVFLSFRGEDTRRNFVSHLYASLTNAGVNTFLDDEKIERGTQLVTEIWRAIEGSRIFIVVFSKAFAHSSWCLHEMVMIMECHRNMGQVVLPVFYDVDPSHVRRHKGAFGEALEAHATKYPRVSNFVGLCKRALTEAANLPGWDVSKCRNESKVVNQIVSAVLEKLDISNLPITDYPVGLESRLQDVIQFLETRSTSVCVIGIWGMGGIGKTTIAKASYNKIHRNFSDKSFLENIREEWEKDRGQIDLQEQLLLDILKTGKIKVQSIEKGKAMIKERLRSKRVLLVLDDVNKSEQLNALSGLVQEV
ncbi:TMV resistance protein N [Spatholobus suberectus]|nr:TMV resistance protein N [Spatholobus suberectus]